jgi:DNA-directed RNA polymerase subunit K/omega
MDYDLKKKTSEHTNNKYETVIVASKIARKLNMERLSEAENLAPDEPIPIHKVKVTVEALNALADGKVKFKFREDKSQEEEIFPEL